MKKLIIGTLIVYSFLLFPTPYLFAQSGSSITGADIMDTFSLTVSPATPRPQQSVIVSVDGSGVNLSTANISWNVNGTRVKGGLGERTVSFIMGPLGSQTTVDVRIESGENVFTRSAVVRSSEVDILWQGETYTAPFYKGRSLWSSQSKITLVAIPHGVGNVNLSNLNYRWTKNGTVLGSLSGVGRNTLSLTDTVLSKSQTIDVEVLSGQGTPLASASVLVTPVSPTFAFYENNPLHGFMFHREISGTYELKSPEVTFSAFPFFFSASNRFDANMTYEWRVNDTDPKIGNSSTYRAPEQTEGTSRISVHASHRDWILQDIDREFLIQFGQ